MMKKIFDIFMLDGYEIYLVGGYVRDYILHIKSHDFDFATSALPDETIDILEKNNLPIIPIGEKFGTIGTFIDGQKVEITTFRSKESYIKGSRRPSVAWGKTIQEDLSRRDLTINSLAMNSEGDIIDCFGGVKDLKNYLLRTPVDPHISFSDDPLRMLRVCRFVSRRFGYPSLEVALAMTELSHNILDISKERIFDEVSKILMTNDPSLGLQLMVNTGLMKHIFPEIQKVVDFKNDQGKYHSKNVWQHTLQVVERCPKKLELKWAALFHDIAKPGTYSVNDGEVHFYQHDFYGARIWNDVAKRLKVGNDFKEYVHVLVEEHMTPSVLCESDVSKSGLRRFVRRVGDKLEDIFLLSLADITSHREDRVKEKRNQCLALKTRVDRVIEEDNVVEIKLPKGLGFILADQLNLQGRELGKVMQQLLQKLIDGEIKQNCDFVEEAKKIIKE